MYSYPQTANAMEGPSTSTFLSSPNSSIPEDRQTLIATRQARPQTEAVESVSTWYQIRNVSENHGSATTTSADWKPTIHGDQFTSTSASHAQIFDSEKVLSKWPVYQKRYSSEVSIKTPLSTDHSLSSSAWNGRLHYAINSNGLHDSPKPSIEELNETSVAASHQDTLIDPTMNIGNVPIEANKISPHERQIDHHDLISVPATPHSAAKIEPAQSEDCYDKPIGEEKFAAPQVLPVTFIHPMNIGNVSMKDRCYSKPFEAETFATPQVSPAEFVFLTNGSNVSIEQSTNWPPHSSEEYILSDKSIPTASVPSDVIPTSAPSQTPNNVRTSNIVQTPNNVRTPNIVQTPNDVRTPNNVHTPNIVQTPDIIQTPNIVQTPNHTRAKTSSVKAQKRPYNRKNKIHVQSNERINQINQMTSKSSLKLPLQNETEPISLKRKNTETLRSHAPAKMIIIPPTRNEPVANSTRVSSLKRKNQDKSLFIPAKKPVENIKNGTAVTDVRRNEPNSSGQSYEEFVNFLSRNDVSVFKVPPSPVPTKPLPVRQDPSHIDWEKYRRIFKINNVTIERVRN